MPHRAKLLISAAIQPGAAKRLPSSFDVNRRQFAVSGATAQAAILAVRPQGPGEVPPPAIPATFAGACRDRQPRIAGA
jgi:hypothetical protein